MLRQLSLVNFIEKKALERSEIEQLPRKSKLHFAQSSRANLIFCYKPERTTPAEKKYRLGIAALWGK